MGFTNKKITSIMKWFFLAGAGLAFQSRTSCSLLPGRLRSLTSTSCRSFLKTLQVFAFLEPFTTVRVLSSLLSGFKIKKTFQKTEKVNIAGAGLEPAASGLWGGTWELFPASNYFRLSYFSYILHSFPLFATKKLQMTSEKPFFYLM